MFVHVSPNIESFGESMSSLQFAQRVSSVALGEARQNLDSSKDLHDSIAKLKDDIKSKDATIMSLRAGERKQQKEAEAGNSAHMHQMKEELKKMARELEKSRVESAKYQTKVHTLEKRVALSSRQVHFTFVAFTGLLIEVLMCLAILTLCHRVLREAGAGQKIRYLTAQTL